MERLQPVERPKEWPEWCFWKGSTFEKYAYRYSHRNHWRVRRTLPSIEDCMQECASDWVYCRNHYARSVDNPAWFMSLYKLALNSTFTMAAKKDTKHRHVVPREDILARIKQSGIHEEPSELLTPITYQEGPALCRLQEASAELRDVLRMLANAPAEMLESIPTWPGRSHILSELKELFDVPAKSRVQRAKEHA